MPELPEVEHLRRTLLPRLVGRRVTRVRLLRRDVVARPADPPGGFSRTGRSPTTRAVPPRELLSQQRITGLLRHGKQLAIVTDAGRALCVHLGMSGQILHVPPRARLPRPTHVHAMWTLDDASRLLFRDPRRFGGLWAFASLQDLHDARWAALGPDALTITAPALRARLQRTGRNLKAALLDQGIVAGIGNIYADEALFAARLHPARRADSTDVGEASRLARAIRALLRRAVEAGGSTLRDYADASGAPGAFQLSHDVYGRGGHPCRSCATPLRATLLAQRTTVWCPSCQRAASPPVIPTTARPGAAQISLSSHEERI